MAVKAWGVQVCFSSSFTFLAHTTNSESSISRLLAGFVPRWLKRVPFCYRGRSQLKRCSPGNAALLSRRSSDPDVTSTAKKQTNSIPGRDFASGELHTAYYAPTALKSRKRNFRAYPPQRNGIQKHNSPTKAGVHRKVPAAPAGCHSAPRSP